MKAINKKHQSMVNKAVNWLIKYNQFNDQRNIVEGNFDCDSKEWRKINKKCEDSFNKYEDYASELPKREVEQIEKSEIY